MDYVDRVRAEWAEQRPDLDTATSAVGARLRRVAALLEAALERSAARHDVSRAEFDVLAALRRAGRPLRAGEVTTMTGAPAPRSPSASTGSSAPASWSAPSRSATGAASSSH